MNTLSEIENANVESFSVIGREDMEWLQSDTIKYQSLPCDSTSWIVVERDGKEIERFNVQNVISIKWENSSR